MLSNDFKNYVIEPSLKTKINIYVGHTTKEYDFKEELYKPLRSSFLNDYVNIVLPHEYSDKPFNSKEFLKQCHCMVAEVSYPSTGLGIELGWASLYDIPIICFYKKGLKPSSSLSVITNKFIEYKNIQDLSNILFIELSNQINKVYLNKTQP